MPHRLSLPGSVFLRPLSWFCLLAWLGLGFELWMTRVPVPRTTTLAGISRRTVGLSPDGTLLVTADGSEVASLTFWDTVTGEQRGVIGKLPSGEGVSLSNPIHAPAFSADGKTVAAALGSVTSGGLYDCRAMGIWDVATLQRIARIETREWIGAFGYSPDGRKLAVGEARQTCLYDLDTGQSSRLDMQSMHGQLLFTPDGKSLAEIHVGSGPQQLLDVATGQRRLPFDVSARPARSMLGTAAAFSADGKQLVCGLTSLLNASYSSFLVIWDAETGAIHKQLPVKLHSVQTLGVSRDGAILAVAGRDDDAEAREWGKILGASRARRLFPAKDYTALLDMKTGRQIGLLPYSWHFAFAPDGKTLVMAAESEDAVQFWDIPPRMRIQWSGALILLPLPAILTALWWRGWRRATQPPREERIRPA